MRPDPIFGEGCTAHRLDLGEDAEGRLIATLIHRTPPPEGPGPDPALAPVLVMHGWSDYVMDRGLLDHLGRRGHDVFALDLRKHGRSLLPGQTPTAIDHLSRYDREIGLALRIIGRRRPPILLAHSTGGLIAALYAQRHPRAVHGLVLNSPWLEMHLGSTTRHLLTGPMGMLAGQIRDRSFLPLAKDHAARATHRDFGGQYDYDLALKPPQGHPLPASTLAAVLEGQGRLAAAGPLAIPVLVLHSARSLIGLRWQEGMRRADTVLDVRSLAAAARRLGPDVEVVALEGARHEVFLSDADVRAEALGALDDWLDENGAASPGTRSRRT
ncbi:alpha/beta hydrolase [Brachybacterium sp. DNPG3]